MSKAACIPATPPPTTNALVELGPSPGAASGMVSCLVVTIHHSFLADDATNHYFNCADK
jgi:hypothetical protein